MTILNIKKKSVQGKSDTNTSQATPNNSGLNNHGSTLGSIQNQPQTNDRLQDERFDSTHTCHSRELKRACHLCNDNGLKSCLRYKRQHSPSMKTRNAKHRGHPQESASSSVYKAGPSDDTQDTLSCGYNSGDEYDSHIFGEMKEADWLEKDQLFEKKMQKKGLVLKVMVGDGACLFRAVADQVYGDQEMHDVVRKHCMDYMAANSDYFSEYVTEDFNMYVTRKRQEYTHGNHIEMQAMSEMYNRTIEVYCYGKDPINIFHGDRVQQTDNNPIRVSYQRGSHYNSIVDPYKATIGVGLGLPNFSPGGADRSLVKDAVRQSENFHIEQAMLEDKLRATDFEATNEAMEEQVARESYLQWLRDSEKRNKALGKPSTDTATSTSTTSEVCKSPLPHASSSNNDQETTLNSQSFNFESSSFLNLPSSMFGMSEWEDRGLLAEVLAASQQEYLDNLKKTRNANIANSSQDLQSSDFNTSFGDPTSSS